MKMKFFPGSRKFQAYKEGYLLKHNVLLLILYYEYYCFYRYSAFNNSVRRISFGVFVVLSFAYNGKNAQTKFIRSDDGILVIGANGFEFNFISDWVILS